MDDQVDAQVWKFRLSCMVADDDGSGLQMIGTRLLALPAASVSDDSEATRTLERWTRSGSPQPPAEVIALTRVDASLQGVVRLDVLLHYLDTPTKLFDGVASSWGAEGPLAVQLRDGRLVLVDGNHRWVAALLMGRKHLRIQVLPADEV